MIHIKSFEEIPTRGVALLDLQNHHCRFPLKDEPGFCGAVRLEHSSYCGPCHARAYRGASGSRSTVAGRVLDMACEAVAPAREGRAQQIVTEATALHDMGVPLDQFVRAAAAARREAPPRPVAVIERPQVIVRHAINPYVAPVSSDDEHATREASYLADLARQNDKVVADIAGQAERGINYASNLRDRIARALELSMDELLCKRRTPEIVLPRQFAMFCVCRGALKLSLPYIGRCVFGGFDHTTILYARDKIEGMIADGSLPSRLAALLDDLCASDAVIAAAVRKARASNPGSESSTE